MSTSIKGGGSPFIENFFEDDNLNATNLFNNMEPPLTEELLKKVIAAQPSSPKWGDALGNLYFLESQQTASRAPQALAEFETAQSLDKDEASQSFRLSNLTKSAYASGDMEKAAHYANALLESAQKNPRQRNYGDAIHQGEHDPRSHRLKKRRHRTSKILSDQSRQYARFYSTEFLWLQHKPCPRFDRNRRQGHIAPVFCTMPQILENGQHRARCMGSCSQGWQDTGFWRQSGLLISIEDQNSFHK